MEEQSKAGGEKMNRILVIDSGCVFVFKRYKAAQYSGVEWGLLKIGQRTYYIID